MSIEATKDPIVVTTHDAVLIRAEASIDFPLLIPVTFPESKLTNGPGCGRRLTGGNPAECCHFTD